MKRWLTRAAVALVPLLWLAGCSVWRVSHPSHAWETEPPALPAALGSPALLVFSKTNGYRHDDGIRAGVDALERMALQRGWGLVHTESSAAFSPEILSHFAVTVWLNTSGPGPGSRRAAVSSASTARAETSAMSRAGTPSR